MATMDQGMGITGTPNSVLNLTRLVRATLATVQNGEETK